MFIRYVSDLHLEFGEIEDLPPLPNDKDTVLVLAGDIGLFKNFSTFWGFLHSCSKQFKAVIYVPGNHEFYHDDFFEGYNKAKDALSHTRFGIENVYLCDRDTITIGDVHFICGTLWTSCESDQEGFMVRARLFMNDFQIITYGENENGTTHMFSPYDSVDQFNKTHKYFKQQVDRIKGKKVIVSHHAPSHQSVVEKYRTGPYSDFNPLFCSEIIDDFKDKGVDLWIHGHMHDSIDYMSSAGIRVVCNPRGYVGHQLNPKFDPTAVIEL